MAEQKKRILPGDELPYLLRRRAQAVQQIRFRRPALSAGFAAIGGIDEVCYGLCILNRGTSK
jgi:hypothetical protein